MAKDSPNSRANQKPFQKFQNLVRKLIHVPKDKIREPKGEPPQAQR
jgi:hypothetical protein